MFLSQFKKFRWQNLWLIFLIFLVVTVWVFSGWPQIWNNPPFPQKIQEARAAIASAGTLGATADKTSDQSFITHTTTATAEAGNIIVVVIAKDNIQSGDSTTHNDVTGVADSAGNTYTKAHEFTNGQTSAQSGAHVSVWFSKVTTQLNSGGTITATFVTSDSNDAAAISAWEFTVASGNTLQVKIATELANDNANPGSMTLSGLANQQWLFFRGIAAETNNSTLTATTSFTALTGANTTGAQEATNMSVTGEFRILTGTAATSNPTLGDTSNDNASVFIAFTEQTTTLGPGTDPATATVAPESGIRDAGAFTFQTNVGTDSITALTVTLAGAGTPYDGLSEVRITSDNGETTYFTAISNPSSNTLNFSGTPNIPVSTTQTQFKIRVTPKTHAAMDSPPGAEYNLSPYVSDWTSGNPNTKAGSDSNANTLTIDNLSPDNTTSNSGSAGYAQVTIYYTTPADSDLNSVVVLRDTSAVTDNPVEGATYIVGNTIGTATVACVDTTVNPSTADSCIDTGLTGGTPYHYKIFAKDNNGNYATGIVPTGSPFTPEMPTYGNIDSVHKYAWGENIGWMNWRPNFGGVTVYNECLTGYIWGENVGWIKVGDDSCTGDDCCQSGTSYGYENDSNSTDDDGDEKIDDWGVNNDGSGNLSGYAWGENVGWINFKDESGNNYHRVVINSSGEFTNYAWGENVGWINMNCANTTYCETVDFKVKTSWTAEAPSLTFNIDSDIKNLGDITPGTPITKTTTTTVTISDPAGYSLKVHDGVSGSNSALLHTDTTTIITDYSDTIASPTLWSGTGLGICVYAATNKNEAKWGTGTTETDENNKYAGIPETDTEIHNVSTNVTNDNTSIGYKLDVPNTQKTGSYSGTITYTVVVNIP